VGQLTFVANYLPSQQSAKFAKARIKAPPSSARIDAAYIDLVSIVAAAATADEQAE
jgi:hypothetical protein